MSQLAIIGSRDFKNLDLVRKIIRKLQKSTTILSGGARGVDAVAAHEALQCGLNLIVFPVPSWEWKKSKGAGFKRNELIVNSLNEEDGLIAFWDGKSKGTLHSVNLVKKRNLWYRVYLENGEIHAFYSKN